MLLNDVTGPATNHFFTQINSLTIQSLRSQAFLEQVTYVMNLYFNRNQLNLKLVDDDIFHSCLKLLSLVLNEHTFQINYKEEQHLDVNALVDILTKLKV